MTTASIVYGDGKKSPFHMQNFRNEESWKIEGILDICDREGIVRLNVAYSGRFYEKKNDGWYLTDTCDRVHKIPREGFTQQEQG